MRKRCQKGFGVLEVVIASMILVTVVGAVVALGSASVKGSVTASDKTIAYNLVQECLEAVRAERNTAWVETAGATPKEWYGNFADDNDIVSTNLRNAGGKCANTSVGTPSINFTRTINVSKVGWYDTGATPVGPKDGNGQEIPTDKIRKVTVNVSWMSENGSRTISGSTYLTDWKVLN